MYRRKSKAHDMARSILPSTARKGARDDKRNFHKRHRAKIREVLETTDDWEDEGYLDPNWMPRKDGFYWDVVEGRRGSDKLNHFVHWAKRITDHLPQEDKMDYIRPMLPPGLIGAHAESHLYELRPDRYHRYRGWSYSSEPEDPRVVAANERIAHWNTEIVAAMEALEGNQKAMAKFNHNYYHWAVSQAQANARKASGWKTDANGNSYYHVAEPVVHYSEFTSLNHNWRKHVIIGKFWQRDFSRYDWKTLQYVHTEDKIIDRCIRELGSNFTRFLSNYFKVEHP
jgi:hypothetical protein